jgi:hypothetical protein
VSAGYVPSLTRQRNGTKTVWIKNVYTDEASRLWFAHSCRSQAGRLCYDAAYSQSRWIWLRITAMWSIADATPFSSDSIG